MIHFGTPADRLPPQVFLLFAGVFAMSAVAQSGPASRPVSQTGDRPIKTFLFDMGNVLVKFCHERMCRQIGELCGHEGPK